MKKTLLGLAGVMILAAPVTTVAHSDNSLSVIPPYSYERLSATMTDTLVGVIRVQPKIALSGSATYNSLFGVDGTVSLMIYKNIVAAFNAQVWPPTANKTLLDNAVLLCLQQDSTILMRSSSNEYLDISTGENRSQTLAVLWAELSGTQQWNAATADNFYFQLTSRGSADPYVTVQNAFGPNNFFDRLFKPVA